MMQQALWIGLTEICTKSIFLKQEQDLRKQCVLDDKHGHLYDGNHKCPVDAVERGLLDALLVLSRAVLFGAEKKDFCR